MPLIFLGIVPPYCKSLFVDWVRSADFVENWSFFHSLARIFPGTASSQFLDPADSCVACAYRELRMARQHSCRAQVITLHALYSLTSCR
jgi:hypothetical protein